MSGGRGGGVGGLRGGWLPFLWVVFVCVRICVCMCVREDGLREIYVQEMCTVSD